MKRLLAIMVSLSFCAAASADFNTGFEAPDYSAAAAGVVLTGQQGWYLPASSADFKAYTYTGNAPGFAANPEGSDQFVAGRSDGTTFGRAEHAVDFSTSNQWVISFDFAAVWDGVAPSAANLGSFSAQPSTTTRSFIALNNCTDLANPAAGWKAEFNVYDAANVALNNQSPGAAWTNLLYNHWYRETVAIDLATNAITSVAIRDLSTAVTDTYSPTGWYLQGGASPTLPLPTAIRMFAGGAAGNNTGWDNPNISVPEPSALVLVLLGAFGLRRR